MSDWRQQEECEERLWFVEKLLGRMERDVKRGSALQQILKAERAAACQRTSLNSTGKHHEILENERTV